MEALRLPFAGPRPSRWLTPALFTVGFGTELWARYLPAYLRALGAGPRTIGLFGSLEDFLDAAYAYPGGALSDRFGTRRALLLFGAASIAGSFGYLLAGTPGAAFAALLLAAAWSSLGLPATFAAVAESSPPGRRTAGFTAQAVVKRLPALAAPPLGGLLLERLGTVPGMRVALALSIVVSAATLFAVGRSARSDPETPPSARPAPRPTRTRLHPALRRLLVSDCLVRLCEGLPSVFLVLWALEVVGVTPAEFGLLHAIGTAAAIVAYLPGVAWRGAPPKALVVATFAFFAAFPLAVVSARSFAGLAAAYVIGGLREIGEPARKALLVDLAAAPNRGRVVGTYYAIRGFTVAGAAAVGGLLWSVRPALTFVVAAVLGAAGTLWCAVALPARPATAEASV